MTPALRFRSLCLVAIAAAFSLVPAVAENAETELSTHDEAGVLGLQPVSQQDLARQLTAKDLIGAKVVGTDEEALGDIVDIGLVHDVDTQNRLSDPGRVDDIVAPETSGILGMHPTAPLADAPEGDARRMQTQPVEVNARTPIAVIAVGGLLGMGERLVSVPLASLKFHPENDRFSLPVSKVEFEAMLDDRTRKTDTTAAARSGTVDDSKAGATAEKMMREDLSAAAAGIREALAGNPAVQPSASMLLVSDDGVAITISGAVRSETDKERVLALAREITRHTIIDQIRVDG